MNAYVSHVQTRERRKLAAPVEARLRKNIQALEDAVLRARAAEDPDAIHDLRVASRRLSVFLRVWDVLVPRGCLRRIVRDLRGLRRRAGRARDLEVQVEMLRERLARHDSPDGEARELLRDLEAELEGRRGRAGKRARSRRSRRVMALLARAEQGWKKDLLSRLEAFEVAHACERERRQAALEGVRAALDAGDDAGLHAARIATKKWRYALESLGMADLEAERFELQQRFRAHGAELLRSVEAPP